MDYPVFEKKILFQLESFQKILKLRVNDRIRKMVGPGVPHSKCVNEECPFTFDDVVDIPYGKLLTWKEDDKI